MRQLTARRGTPVISVAQYRREVGLTVPTRQPGGTPVSSPQPRSEKRYARQAEQAELARQAALAESGEPVVECVIPGEPVSKGRPRHGTDAEGHHRTWTPKETRVAEAKARKVLVAAMGGGDRFYRFGPVKVAAVFYLSAVGGRDIDNLVKLLFDAANGVVWRDDVQVEEQHAARRLDPDRPRTVLRVSASGVPLYRPCLRCGAWTRNARYCARRCSI